MQATTDLRADLALLPSDWRLVRVGPDKAPIAGTGWFDVDDYSPDDAAELNGSMPPAWGLKCGPASGSLVLDLDAPGWRDSFQEATGHPITDLPRTIGWSSGKPERSAHAFAVDPDWWPYLRNRVSFTRPWQEGDPLGKDGKRSDVTIWELRWDRHQSVVIGKHPETGAYRWLPERSPADIPEPAPAPDWLLDLLVVQELADVAPVEPTAEDADRAVAMLSHLPANAFSAYDDWLRVGMALHHTDPGLLTDWVDWCRGMANFDDAECLRKWASFGKGHRGRPATIATLHHLAKEHGYKEPKRKRKARQAPAAAAQAAPAGPPPEAPYRLLGWDTKMQNVWVQAGGTGQAAAIPANKNGLQRIAPIGYWEALHKGRNSVDWDAAVSSFCEAAHAVGSVFTPDRLRGHGVWIDRDRVVWNLGNRLEVDGALVPLSALRDSSWTYAALTPLEIDPCIPPLTDAEGAAILNLLHRQMEWEAPGHGLLVAGHAVIGNVGGALDLRPGLQVTGPSQRGKSTLLNKVILRLLGGLALDSAASTEAGIRQKLQSSALPVIIDESEQEDATKREGHLRLMRLCFDGKPQHKGTPGGGQAVSYSLRSTMTLSGINATVPNQADRNRMVFVEPGRLTPEKWAAFQQKRDSILTMQTGHRLIRRTISHLPALRANIAVFTATVAGLTSTSRSAEVYGTLLAGAHHLTSTARLDQEGALAWLDSVGWAGLDEDAKEAISADAEGLACLDHLLSFPVMWKTSETGSTDVRSLLHDAKTVIKADEARKALGRLGIAYDQAHGLVVSNTTKVFKGTRWANGAHKDRLRELPGADRLATPHRFSGGGKTRAVAVPWSLVEPED